MPAPRERGVDGNARKIAALGRGAGGGRRRGERPAGDGGRHPLPDPETLRDRFRAWGVDDGECKRVLKGHSKFVNSVAFAPARPGEAALLASGSPTARART